MSFMRIIDIDVTLGDNFWYELWSTVNLKITPLWIL